MRGIWCAAVVLGMVTGCGLSDYEKRMDEQRERLARLDEEATLLGDLIDLPRGKDAYGNEIQFPFEIFLRLPKGVSGSFKGKEAIYYGDKQPLYRFAGKQDVNVLVAWTKIADKNATTKPKDDELSPEQFRARVRTALQDFLTRTYSVNANLPDFAQLKKDTRATVRDGLKRTLEFDATQFDEPLKQAPARFFVFIQVFSDRQAAVIYQAPVQQADQQFQRTMDISLKTLEITGSAKAQRIAFKYRN